MMLQVTAAH